MVQLAVAKKKIQVSRWKRSKGNWKRESAPAQLESVPQRLEKVRNFLLLQAPPIRLKCDASIYGLWDGSLRVYVSVLEYLVVEEFGSLLESKYLHWIQVLMNESAKL